MKGFKTKIGGKEIEIEIKDWALRANGEVLVKSGETQVLVTAVMSDRETDKPYFPLMVNYEERYYARGEILGSRFLRRESRPTTNATLIARAIDRSIRPLFPKGMRREIQVIVTCLAWDEENDPDFLGALGASIALHISDIPWAGPMGAVRVAEVENELKINPTYEEREKAELEIFFTGLKENENPIINMIEMEGDEADEEKIVQAAKKGGKEIMKLCALQEKIREEIGKEKVTLEEKKADPENEEFKKEIRKEAKEKIEELLFGKSPSKSSLERSKKLNELKEEISENVKENSTEEKAKTAEDVFEEEVGKLIHEKALEGKRVDGRKVDEVRRIDLSAKPVQRVHGSGYFARGLTRSISVLTLGGPEEYKILEGMEVMGEKRFLHHYNFSPYSVGEVRFLRAPGRREIGHGMLAEKALKPVIPSKEDFPYTVRLVTEILTSNGSTSMSSICSSTLALMDGGVPIKRPVAGIAIGLAKKEENWQILTDIQGPEDFHGDMDLKVGGTREGVTAMQMDVKFKGVTEEILKEALKRARKARLEILDQIEDEISKPRESLSTYAPQVIKLQIPEDKIGRVIGSGGRTIKSITERTGAEISIEDGGETYIISQDQNGAEKAKGIIENIVRELEPGQIFTGVVEETLPFGVIVQLCPGKDGLLHKSKYKKDLKKGDKVKVIVANVKRSGKVDLKLQG